MPDDPMLDEVIDERTRITEEEDGGRKSAALVLVDIALEAYSFGVTDAGEPFAVPAAGGHVVRPLRGGRTSLRAELAKRYRQSTGKVPAQQALADALLVLEGDAQESDPVEVHLRVAEAHGAVWVDLGDTAETVARIDQHGWQLVNGGVPVLFRRTSLTGVLPAPEHGGDLAELWELVNVAEADRPLVVAWMVAALLRPRIPHPILALFGEQGSGKSTASRTLVSLVDPSPVPLRKPPRDADGWVTAAQGSWVVGLDNLSTVPDWLSDSLCRAATGEGDVRRQLYTDGGLSVFAFRRVLLLNGIDVGAMRGDLAERLVLVNLERITERTRLTETELGEQWAKAHPRLIGALFDLVAGIAGKSGRNPSVRLGSKPRMADFALVLAQVDDMLGTDGLTRYAEQAKTMAEDTLDADPFLAQLRTQLAEAFTGTAAELLEAVTPSIDGWRAPRDWPRNARAVTSRLKRNAPALRKAGWSVDDRGNANHDGVTVWHITPAASGPEIARNPSPQSPHPRTTGGARGEAGKAGNESQPSQDDSPRADPVGAWGDPARCQGLTPAREVCGFHLQAQPGQHRPGCPQQK